MKNISKKPVNSWSVSCPNCSLVFDIIIDDKKNRSYVMDTWIMLLGNDDGYHYRLSLCEAISSPIKFTCGLKRM